MSDAATKTRREPRQSRSRETISRLLDAAEALVVEHGPDAATLRAVAARAGFAAPTPYRFFADREAVFDAMLERGLAELESHVVAAEATWSPGSAAELMRLELDALAGYLEARPAFTRLWLEGRGSAAVAAEVRARHDALAVRMHAGAVAAGLVPAGTEPLVFAVAVELGDRILQLAFTGRSTRDAAIFEQGATALAAYLDRVAPVPPA